MSRATTNLLEVARAAEQSARAKGASAARVTVKRDRTSTVEWRDDALDRVQESVALGLSLSVYVDGRFSASTTSDLRPEGLSRFLDDVLAGARLLKPDPHRRLPDPSRYGARGVADTTGFDATGLAEQTPQKRAARARALCEAVRAAAPKGRLASAQSWASDSEVEVALVTSNGMEGTRRVSRFSEGAEASILDEGGRRPEGYDVADTVFAHRQPGVEAVAGVAVERALGLVGAGPEPSGLYPCVVEGRFAAPLLTWLLAPLFGQALQQKRSVFEGRLGQAIGSPALTLIDDPFVPEGQGSRPFDGEGMAALRRPLFEAGLLKGYLLDTYYASKLGQEPTCGDWSNLVLPPGPKSAPELLAALDRGLWIRGFSGGNSNPTTGDFSIGIRGQWVEGGRVVRPVSEMNLSGNHLTFWKQLVEAGADVNLYSALRTPSLRFGPVQFSGR